MNDLESRLGELGARLRVDEEGLADDVLARLDEAAPRASSTRPWLVAAAVLAAVLAAALVVPSSRRAIADWFGLDGVSIERQPDLSVPGAERLPAGIVVDEFDGSLDPQLLTKVLSADTGIERVDVGDLPGLWIDGAPHELVIRDGSGEVASRRFAGNTLLWQDGDTIRRVEGFDSLEQALAFAAAG